jgi:hypothetical protein
VTPMVWEETPIAKRHNRAHFDRGDPDVNL